MSGRFWSERRKENKGARLRHLAGVAFLGTILVAPGACASVQTRMAAPDGLQAATPPGPGIASGTGPDTGADTGPSIAGGLPPNPQRPFTARTCAAAKARLAEAEAGSPLISAEENQQVLQQARLQAERLCGLP